MTARPLFFARADATLAAIGPLLDALEQALADAGIPDRTARQTMLVVEEIAANAAMHAGIAEPDRAISVDLREGHGGLEATLTYPGNFYDPSAATPSSPGEDTIGGRGLLLVRSIAGRLVYRRENALNVVTIWLAGPEA